MPTVYVLLNVSPADDNVGGDGYPVGVYSALPLAKDAKASLTNRDKDLIIDIVVIGLDDKPKRP